VKGEESPHEESVPGEKKEVWRSTVWKSRSLKNEKIRKKRDY